ncbi:uncharacterized protein LOC119294712 [Triticum dicoccoides]|uniref:uncharacterized protein LOC119294712 n=1 Tax=Triticum dicoccoides TaxID=85692 RepID=UPI001890A971|nr:uncharacterized protein LOC119294712 [Triticum dicoccoides]
MPPISLLPLLLLLLLAGAAAAAPAPAEPPTPTPAPPPPPAKNKTIYELLPLFGLPAGVFPANVTAFSLAGNGSLAVDLAGPCYVHFEYLTYFEPRVTGVLRYGSLTELEGVQVRRFLVWFSVVRVKVDLPPPPRFVYLDIGWITRKLPAADFQSVHACEAGKRRRRCRLPSALAAAAAWFQDFFAQF